MVETTAGATSSYIREASGALIAERTPVGDFYYVRDGQGSVIALVDPTGTQRASYTYDPYGANATATGLNGTLPPNPWRWSGSYLDATGLYKLGARYYDPNLGRFTQIDPVEGGSANDYDYCSGDPVNCSDPGGMRGTKPLPPELAKPCLSGNETELNHPDCRRYQMAKATGDSDYFYKGKTLSTPGKANAFLQSAGRVTKTIGTNAAEFAVGCASMVGTAYATTSRIRPLVQTTVYGNGVIAAGFAGSCLAGGAMGVANIDFSGPGFS